MGLTALAVRLLRDSLSTIVEMIKILIWPITTLIALFYFRKVVTYLFFSMDEFNFFGAKGTLKNVNDLIIEKVNERFLEEKEERERNMQMEKLSSDIEARKREVDSANGTAEQNLKLAKDVLSSWNESSKSSKKIIDDLLSENKKLKEQISKVVLNSSFPPSEQNNVVDAKEVSGSPLSSNPITNELHE